MRPVRRTRRPSCAFSALVIRTRTYLREAVSALGRRDMPGCVARRYESVHGFVATIATLHIGEGLSSALLWLHDVITPVGSISPF